MCLNLPNTLDVCLKFSSFKSVNFYMFINISILVGSMFLRVFLNVFHTAQKMKISIRISSFFVQCQYAYFRNEFQPWYSYIIYANIKECILKDLFLVFRFSEWLHLPVVKSLCLVYIRVLMETLSAQISLCFSNLWNNIDEENNDMEPFDEDSIYNTEDKTDDRF